MNPVGLNYIDSSVHSLDGRSRCAVAIVFLPVTFQGICCEIQGIILNLYCQTGSEVVHARGNSSGIGLVLVDSAVVTIRISFLLPFQGTA
jgi:hypothetical protein